MKQTFKKATLLFVFAALFISLSANAQPEVGSVLIGNFQTAMAGPLVASVIAVNGKEFTCRFSHSNSTYVFVAGDYDGNAKVISSKGGKFPKDSQFYFVEYFIVPDTYGCIVNRTPGEPVIVKFGDGKSFLGDLDHFTEDGGFEIRFWHSWSKYSFDKNGVVTKSGGAYAIGREAKVFCASAAYPAPPSLKLPQLKQQKSTKH